MESGRAVLEGREQGLLLDLAGCALRVEMTRQSGGQLVFARKSIRVVWSGNRGCRQCGDSMSSYSKVYSKYISYSRS